MTEDQKATAIKMAVEGKSLKKIREELGLEAILFWRARQSDADFERQWQEARFEGLEENADELMDIARDETVDLGRARLISENTKWLLSKRKPRAYGDRLDLNVTSAIDLTSTLREAKERVITEIQLPIHYLKDSEKLQDAETTKQLSIHTTDTESVDPFS